MEVILSINLLMIQFLVPKFDPRPILNYWDQVWKGRIFWNECLQSIVGCNRSPHFQRMAMAQKWVTSLGLNHSLFGAHNLKYFEPEPKWVRQLQRLQAALPFRRPASRTKAPRHRMFTPGMKKLMANRFPSNWLNIGLVQTDWQPKLECLWTKMINSVGQLGLSENSVT